MSDNPRLTVIDGSKGQGSTCTGRCAETVESDTAKEPSTSQYPATQELYDAQLRQLKLQRLAHEHRRLRTELEYQMQDLHYELTLEKITLEASLYGVSYGHIKESHERAEEAIEAAQARIA